MMRSCLAVLFCLLPFACGTDDGDSGVADARPGSADARSEADAALRRVDASPGRPDAGRRLPDASTALPACPNTEAIYTGQLFDPVAREGNPNRPDAHFLTLGAGLDPSATPERLGIIAFYRFGVETGTFDLPGGTWVVDVCVDFDQACGESLEPLSGRLEITSVVDRFTGSLTDAVFVDDRNQPTCATTVVSASFDQEIVCAGPGDC